ncbi:hypothetical protein GBAR_LOCUS30246 [Geodia barretti]|uniref:Uncharacterized protein n=1 Tax=Geodia barretti TaxID=519541 RepID=A0AA35TX48_GEOBA|nr:hypothetical protein GBAR_LOCUS30246 [Geodia barretti]
MVTQAINRYLSHEFRVGPELMAKLWMLEKAGQFSNRKVTMVRVFDPELVSTALGARLKYDDLKGNGNEKALRFEGHFEKDGALYLADRRPAAGPQAAASR